MHYVIDCSFSSALFLPDEKSDTARVFFLNLNEKDTIFVPLLWWYETNNVLNISIKRKRLTHNDVIRIYDLINQIKFETDSEYGIDFSKRIFELTQLYTISSYDAVYLELSIRTKAKLATLDDELIITAKKIGIDVN